jgi:crotonobetainyl-CoA:carnitine CoA-transferase CaiB-like acyl-CoA transferase
MPTATEDQGGPETIKAPGQPFAGIEVVEFGQFIAVPFCAQVLSQGGARVIKVEPLEGDPVRQLAPLAPGETRHFICRNRGKHSLPLQLKHRSAPRIIDALLRRADVALTNFRPGLATELGLDYAALSLRYPRLVVGNVSAFGGRGPDASLAGMDMVVQARSGLMAANGRVRDGLPIAGDPPVIDYMCAMSLAFGIAAALLRRQRTGRGGEVEASLLMAALTLQNNSMVRVTAVDGPLHAELLGRLGELRAAGEPYGRQAASLPESLIMPAMRRVYYRTFRTKDAAIAIACVSPGLQRALMRAMGLADETHDGGVAGAQAQARHYHALGDRVEAVMASRTTAEWKAIFDAHGVPASGVKFPLELLDDEQALANRMLHDVPHPTLGPVRVLSPPIDLDSEGFRPSPATPPFGSETREILRGAGFTDRDIEALIAEGVTTEKPGRE